MLRRVPKDLPLFGALLLGLSLLAFGYTGFYVDGQFGRLSSTSSLALLFIPIWGALAATIGLIVGFIVRAIWRRAKEHPDQQRRTWVLVGILSGAVVLSAGAGALDVVWYEHQAKPKIRLDTGDITRELRADSETPSMNILRVSTLWRRVSGLRWSVHFRSLKCAFALVGPVHS